jgi:hypothetical protein
VCFHDKRFESPYKMDLKPCILELTTLTGELVVYKTYDIFLISNYVIYETTTFNEMGPWERGMVIKLYKGRENRPHGVPFGAPTENLIPLY